MTSSWHTLGRNSRTRRNAKALEQLSATLQQWTETLSARIESVDLTAAQHRATQTQLIANVKSSLDNLPAPKATSSWHTLDRNSRTRRNAKALEQLSATLQQWTETLSARIESVDLTAAQHRATQTQLIANVKSSLDNLPAPKAAPPKPLAGAELSTEPPTGEPASGAEVHALRATFESWHTTTWTRIENLTLRLDEMEARQAKTSDVTTQQMAELTAEIRAVVGSLNEQQPE